MKNTIKIIRNNEYETNLWTGGTTTQLLIYPKGSEYRDRNFIWRISSAKVDAIESVFTFLPGISRILMIIDGEVTLEHEGKHKVVLKPFEQDSFMGDWTTKSFGKGTDFNLMLAEGCNGKLETVSVKGGGIVNILLNEGKENSQQITNVFYLVSGSGALTIQNHEYNIYEHDLLSITQPVKGEDCDFDIYNKYDREMKIIRAIICY